MCHPSTCGFPLQITSPNSWRSLRASYFVFHASCFPILRPVLETAWMGTVRKPAEWKGKYFQVQAPCCGTSLHQSVLSAHFYITIFAIKRTDIDGWVTAWLSVQRDIKSSCVVQLTARKTAYCMNRSQYRCQRYVSLVFARPISGWRSQLTIHPSTTAGESRGLTNGRQLFAVQTWCHCDMTSQV